MNGKLDWTFLGVLIGTYLLGGVLMLLGLFAL